MTTSNTNAGNTGAMPVAPVRPAPGNPRPYHFPAFESHVLANGLKVTVAPLHELPVVTTLAVVEAGATHDEDGHEGLARIATRALTEGTHKMDALTLATRLEMLGTTLDTGADWDSAIAQLTALTSRVDDAMAVLSEVLQTPSFPVSELERLRSERLAELAQLRAEPRGLAEMFFTKLLYVPESRFSRPAGGDEASIMRLTRETVQGFHEKWYKPSAVSLMIVGDITVERALKLANEHFGNWQGKAPTPVEPITSQRYTEPRVHLINKSDAPQSELRVGHVAIPRLHPDYFPVVVMNGILGGLFSSRLNLNLREEHAYTYGAHSAFAWRRAASPIVVSTAVETAVTADALKEIIHEFNRIREAPVSDAELSLAISYLTGVFPIRFETTAEVAGGLANVDIFQLPTDYFDTYREQIAAVTAEDVLRVARTHLDPSRLQVVVVGDAQAIKEPVSALGIGTVQVYEAGDSNSALPT